MEKSYGKRSFFWCSNKNRRRKNKNNGVDFFIDIVIKTGDKGDRGN
jgi:hypothetical protein